MNTPEKSALCALALCAGACLSPAASDSAQAAMAGAWASLDGKTTLYIEGSSCVQVEQEAQMLFELKYIGGQALRTQVYLGQPVPGGLELDGEGLLLVDPVAAENQRFRRLPEIPDGVRIEPFELGSLPSNAASRDAIARNLIQRDAISERLRRSVEENMEAAHLAGRLNTFEDQLQLLRSPKMVALREQMLANSATNTLHLGFLLRSSGWITREAYGEEAQLAAFNMLRFGGNLRSMRSVLPALKLELAGNGDLGYLYSLLYDSIQLSMGNKQLYGTLLQPDIDGRMRLRRVADKANLDRRRMALGLPPIRQFLAHFEQRLGQIEVED